MNNHLCQDVTQHILVHYAASHAPLWRLGCDAWRCMRGTSELCNGFTIRGVYPVHGFNLMQLALWGSNERLFEWVQERRTYTHGAGLAFSIPAVLRILPAAAQAGLDRLVWTWVEHWWDVIDLGCILSAAARGGRQTIVDFCRHEWYPKLLDMTMCEIVDGNPDENILTQKRLQRIEHMIHNARVARHARDAMAAAARGGHAALVRIFHAEWGVSGAHVNRAIQSAARGGHETIVRLCHDEFGATNVDLTMAHAAGKGHEHIVRLCHDEWNATDVTLAADYAANAGEWAIFRLCYDWGAIVPADYFRLMLHAEGHDT